MLKNKIVVDIDKLKDIRNHLLDINRSEYDDITDGIEEAVFEIGNIILNNERI